MKNVVQFMLFLCYATIIFFFPNNEWILLLFVINFIIMIATRASFKKALISILKILPFIAFTFIFNVILDTFINAVWIGIKLILVCNITFSYSQTTTIYGIAHTVKILCNPLKLFKINPEEIEIMVCISLSMIPILKKELLELKDSCKAKNIDINLKNSKIILSKLLYSIIQRVNEIDEALIEKGYDY